MPLPSSPLTLPQLVSSDGGASSHRISRLGVVATPYNPLTAIPWVEAYWTEGPLFVALGLANGAAITTWPSEGTGAHAAAQAVGAAQPVYQSAGVINSKPTGRWTVAKSLLTGAWTAIAQPLTIVTVFQLTTVTQGVTYVVHDGIGGTNRASLFSQVASAPDAWAITAGTTVNSVMSVDTAAHLSIATFDATDTLELDAVSIISGNAGAQTLTGLALGAAFNGTLGMVGDLAFLGMINRVLTAPEKAALHTWSQSHYGTA